MLTITQILTSNTQFAQVKMAKRNEVTQPIQVPSLQDYPLCVFLLNCTLLTVPLQRHLHLWDHPMFCSPGSKLSCWRSKLPIFHFITPQRSLTLKPHRNFSLLLLAVAFSILATSACSQGTSLSCFICSQLLGSSPQGVLESLTTISNRYRTSSTSQELHSLLLLLASLTFSFHFN